MWIPVKNNPPPGFPSPGGRKLPLKIDSLPVSWILIQQVDLTTDVKKNYLCHRADIFLMRQKWFGTFPAY